MTGYIERKVLYQAFVFYAGKRIPEVDVDGLPITVDLQTIKKTIRELPAADVAPVVHARLEVRSISEQSEDFGELESEVLVCTNCDAVVNACVDYCPHCGARMDGDAHD